MTPGTGSARRSGPARPGTRAPAARAFSLAELLVVIGVIALLAALMVPPLQLARRQAMKTQCSMNLQYLGRALRSTETEYRFYPYWDDGGDRLRFTWIDVLFERGMLGTTGGGAAAGGAVSPLAAGSPFRLAYCPADHLPDPLNETRHVELVYPVDRRRHGMDYSYGIGVPLAAGGWAWRPGYHPAADDRPRKFVGHELDQSGRVLAGDAHTSAIVNLSGQAFRSGIWNDPTQFDNTVAWGRHPVDGGKRLAANLLFQDGHVSTVAYAPSADEPLNTSRQFVWHPAEPLTVGPEDEHEGQFYPNALPPSFQSLPRGRVYPDELLPSWYTTNGRWTAILHK